MRRFFRENEWAWALVLGPPFFLSLWGVGATLAHWTMDPASPTLVMVILEECHWLAELLRRIW